jgi:pyridoxine 5-phosphate synthase
MVSLSVNVNKVATLRNSRGGSIPRVIDAVDVCVKAGAPGITVHPRADERHIRRQDVLDIAALLAEWNKTHDRRVEFNIEGDTREALLEMVCQVRADQCTLVPVTPGEITSHAGWSPGSGSQHVAGVVERLRRAGVRVSVFIDPISEAVRWAAAVNADRIELYTEPFAQAFSRGGQAAQESFSAYRDAALLAHDLGLGVNAGHDLDLDNLVLFRTLPHLDEVSIGHALISHALFVGLERSVRDYLEVLSVK